MRGPGPLVGRFLALMTVDTVESGLGLASNLGFGNMTKLLFRFPQLCRDIKHRTLELGDPELPHQTGDCHQARADARWTRDAWTFLACLDPLAKERCVEGRRNPEQF